MSGREENNYITEQGDQPNNKREQDKLPALYSKTQILVISLVFSTVFAAFLLRSNLKEIGKKKEGNLILIFAFVFMLAAAALIQVLGLPPNLTFIANVIGAALLNEFFWNKYLGREIEYEKKGWRKPLLISLLITIPFFILVLNSIPA